MDIYNLPAAIQVPRRNPESLSRLRLNFLPQQFAAS